MKRSRIVCAVPMHFVVALICKAERERRDSGCMQSSSKAGSVTCLFLNSMTGFVSQYLGILGAGAFATYRQSDLRPYQTPTSRACLRNTPAQDSL